MPSSTKVQFKLETLKVRALESIDERIQAKQEEVASYADPELMEKLVDDWRATQEAKISALFSRLGDDGISDTELATFEIDAMPEPDIYSHRKAEKELRGLLATRSQIVAKSESLVPNADGNLSLTSTQLEEFFGL